MATRIPGEGECGIKPHGIVEANARRDGSTRHDRRDAAAALAPAAAWAWGLTVDEPGAVAGAGCARLVHLRQPGRNLDRTAQQLGLGRALRNRRASDPARRLGPVRTP